MEDLIDIYILFIRSITEYCAVAFHSSLTQEQSNKLLATLLPWRCVASKPWFQEGKKGVLTLRKVCGT